MCSPSNTLTKIYFCLQFTLFWFSAVSQNAKIDLLKNKLSKNISDKDKIESLYQLATEYWDYDFDIALEYSNECYALAKKNINIKGLAQAYTNLGLYHYFKGDHNTSRLYYDSALIVVGNQIYDDFPAYTYTRIGNLFRVESQFDSALFFYSKALENLPVNNYEIAASSTYYNRGLVLTLKGSYDLAITNLNNSLRLRKDIGDTLLVSESQKAIGLVYLETGIYDSAAYIFNVLDSIADKYDNIEIRIFSRIYTGELHLMKGELLEATNNLKSALEMLSEHEFVQLKILCLYNLGRIYAENGLYDNALDLLLQAEMLNETIGNKLQSAKIFYEIAYIHLYQENPASNSMAQKAKSIFQQVKAKKYIADTYNLLGTINYEKEKYDSASFYYLMSFELQDELKNFKGMAAAKHNLALVHDGLGESKSAINFLLEALALERKTKNNIGVIISYNTIGKAYEKIGKLNEAEYFLNKAKEELIQYPSLKNLEENARFLSDLHYKKQNYPQALEYLKLSMSLTDSLYSLESLEKSMRIQAIYDLSQKELEIVNLKQASQLQTEQLKIKSLQLRHQQYLLVFGSFLIVVVSFSTYFIYRSNKKLKEVRNNLQKSNAEILVTLNTLREAQDRIVESEKLASLGIIAAGIGHEINNPLNFIQGGLHGISKSFKGNQEYQNYLDLIKEGIQRTTGIVRKLSELSQINHSMEEKCSIEILLDACQSSLEQHYQELLPIEKRYFGGDLSIMGNQIRLKQAFFNIIQNAKQAISKEGRIIIQTNRDLSFVSVIIKDDGVGIHKKNLKHIMDPFFTTRQPNDGVGLGLSIAYHIIKEHNGEIKFHSKYKSGTEVTIKFPV